MKLNTLILLLIFFPWFACNITSDNVGAADTATSATALPVTRTVRDVEPELFNADSIQVLYYDNPDGDSLRYTRYFQSTEIGDTARIRSLLKEMDQIYMQEPKGRPCRSEGKLYLLQGDAVLKTIYFSARGDSCTYLYFIKNGSFFYFPLTETAATILKEDKMKARKP